MSDDHLPVSVSTRCRRAVRIETKRAADRPGTFADEEVEAMRPVLRRLLRDRVIVDVR